MHAATQLTLRSVFICAALLVLPCAVASEKAIEQLDIQQPRAYGYHIGDKLERGVRLVLRKPYLLERRSLPQAGRLNDWLSLATPNVVERAGRATTEYDIRLTYQIVNVDPAIQDLPLPRHFFEYSDGAKTLNAHIPATRIRATAIRDSTSTDLAPDETPVLAPRHQARLLFCAGLFVLSVFALATVRWGLPFAAPNHPFVRARVALKVLRRRTWDDACYDEALRTLHRAFNETAGRTVFAEQLDNFFSDHPRYEPIRSPISDYFEYSRRHFFDTEDTLARNGRSLGDLIALAEACCARERRRT